jgi:hypothetical protein
MPNCNPVLSEFEKYLRKKKNKIGNESIGYSRGQKEAIMQMLKKVKKLRKKYK